MKITMKFYSYMDLTRLKKSIHKMNVSSIRKGAALIRLIAARSIRYRTDKTKKSQIGTPPFSHTSKASPYRVAPLRKSIQYLEEKDNERAVIGVSFNGLLDIGYAHEKGGWFKMSRWKRAKHFPKRPFMKPALDKVSPSLPKFWEGQLR